MTYMFTPAGHGRNVKEISDALKFELALSKPGTLTAVNRSTDSMLFSGHTKLYLFPITDLKANIAKLIAKDDLLVGSIVTAELSFRGLVDLLYGLVEYEKETVPMERDQKGSQKTSRPVSGGRS